MFCAYLISQAWAAGEEESCEAQLDECTDTVGKLTKKLEEGSYAYSMLRKIFVDTMPELQGKMHASMQYLCKAMDFDHLSYGVSRDKVVQFCDTVLHGNSLNFTEFYMQLASKVKLSGNAENSYGHEEL